VEQVVADRRDHLPRSLRAAGAIEENSGFAVHGLGQGRELGADPSEIKFRHGGNWNLAAPGERADFQSSKRQGRPPAGIVDDGDWKL
jgi:hypothetical protein